MSCKKIYGKILKKTHTKWECDWLLRRSCFLGFSLFFFPPPLLNSWRSVLPPPIIHFFWGGREGGLQKTTGETWLNFFFTFSLRRKPPSFQEREPREKLLEKKRVKAFFSPLLPFVAPEGSIYQVLAPPLLLFLRVSRWDRVATAYQGGGRAGETCKGMPTPPNKNYSNRLGFWWQKSCQFWSFTWYGHIWQRCSIFFSSEKKKVTRGAGVRKCLHGPEEKLEIMR